MNHHVGSLLQIDWRKEDVSTAAHVISPTGRKNASVGLPGMGEECIAHSDLNQI
jgi:hypothetical protein